MGGEPRHEPRHGNSDWTEEDIDKLKELVQAGQTASQIASVFSGKTRNAVIGKLHRLGISMNRGQSPVKNHVSFWDKDENLRKLAGYVYSGLGHNHRQIAGHFGVTISTVRRGMAKLQEQPSLRPLRPVLDGKTHRRVPRPRAAQAPPIVSELPDEGSRGIPIVELTSTSCRWPVSGQGLTLRYCGHLAVPEKPYCAPHCRRAYAAR